MNGELNTRFFTQTKTFNFQANANNQGILESEKVEHSPIAFTIKRVALTVVNTCASRAHRTNLTVNGRRYLCDAQVMDCQAYHVRESLSVGKGEVSVEVSSDGYNPDELVEVSVEVTASLSPFGVVAEAGIMEPLPVPMDACKRLGDAVHDVVRNLIRREVDREFPNGRKQIAYEWNRKKYCGLILGRQNHGRWKDEYVSIQPDYNSLSLCMDSNAGVIAGKIILFAHGHVHHIQWESGIRLWDATVKADARLEIEIVANMAADKPQVQISHRLSIYNLEVPLPMLQPFVYLALRSALEGELMKNKAQLEKEITEALLQSTMAAPTATAVAESPFPYRFPLETCLERFGVEGVLGDAGLYESMLDEVEACSPGRPDPALPQVFNISSEINPEIVAKFLDGKSFDAEFPQRLEFEGGLLWLENTAVKLTIRAKPGDIRIFLAPQLRVVLDQATVQLELHAKTNVLSGGEISAKADLQLSFEWAWCEQEAEIHEVSLHDLRSPELCPNAPMEPGLCLFVERLLNKEIKKMLNGNRALRSDIAKALNDFVNSILGGGSFSFMNHLGFRSATMASMAFHAREISPQFIDFGRKAKYCISCYRGNDACREYVYKTIEAYGDLHAAAIALAECGPEFQLSPGRCPGH